MKASKQARQRVRLRTAAARIARNSNSSPSTPRVALRKLFVQERRDRTRPSSPVVGWKRGELAEVLLARSRRELAEEWGDVGYYVAQTWVWLWRAYALLTPDHIVQAAVEKFERRAEKGIPK